MAFDSEENKLNIQNEDDSLKMPEENNLNSSGEIFREEEESLNPSEENEKLPEENELRHSKKKQNQKLNLNKASSFSGALSISSVAVTLVGTIALIGTTAGFIPVHKVPSVSNFLSRSTELGFRISKDDDKSYLLRLFNDEYDISENAVERDKIVFSDLQPNTAYDLEVFDINSEPSKLVYSANYLTKSHDHYYAYIEVMELNADSITFAVELEGETPDFMSVEVLGDYSKTLYFHEGRNLSSYTTNISGNSSVAAEVFINGQLVHFEQLLSSDPAPVGKWKYDEDNHWHEVGGEIVDLEPHSFTDKVVREASYDDDGITIHTCDICGYSTTEVTPRLEHHYAEEWTYDENRHWHVCIDEGYEDLQGDLDFHAYDETGTCICGLSAFEFEMMATAPAYKLTGKKPNIPFDISTIVFPETFNNLPVTDLGSKIFPNGGVHYVTVPNCYTHISESVFYGCSEIETMTIPFVGSSASASGEEGFFGYIFGTEGYSVYLPCYWVDMTDYGGQKTYIPQGLVTLNVTGGALANHALRGIYYLENITLSNVTSIGDFAFADYSYYDEAWDKTTECIKSITLDNAVTSIGANVFENNPLTELNFTGTMAEWEAIEKDTAWSEGSSLTTIHCSDGDITL